MRSLLFIFTVSFVVAVAFWAYHENYKTQAALDKVDHLQQQIGIKRERLAVLRAEWAYLNRPDRLRDLADLNFDRLGLLPFSADQFGVLTDVPKTTDLAVLELNGIVDVSSAGAKQ